MTLTELITAGGQLGAFVAVVLMFLKYMRGYNDTISGWVQSHSRALAELTAAITALRISCAENLKANANRDK